MIIDARKKCILLPIGTLSDIHYELDEASKSLLEGDLTDGSTIFEIQTSLNSIREFLSLPQGERNHERFRRNEVKESDGEL